MNEQLKILLTMLLIWIGVALFLYCMINYFKITFIAFVFAFMNVWLYWIVKLAREK